MRQYLKNINNKKNFGCVFHSLIPHKLDRGGFLAHQQCERANDKESNWRLVTQRVPQGSVLRPLPFINVSDTINMTHYCYFHFYAGDLQIYFHFFVNNADRALPLYELRS